MSDDTEKHSGRGDGDRGDGGGEGESSVREQDRYLPIANVGRVMRRALPSNAKISKDAKETMQECVSEFISFITGEASDKCAREKRKTINGDDILWAMSTLGFDDYIDPLRVYLLRYRESESEKGTMGKSDSAEKGHPMMAGGVSGLQSMPSLASGIHHSMQPMPPYGGPMSPQVPSQMYMQHR